MDFPPRERSPRRRRPPDREGDPRFGDAFGEVPEASDAPSELDVPSFARSGGGLEPGVPAEPEPARRPRRRRSETTSRVLWAVPAIVFAVAIVVAGGLVFAAAMIAFACLALTELFQMAARARPFQLVAFAAAAGMILAAHLGGSFQMVIAGVAAFPLMLAFGIARGSPRNLTVSAAFTVFGVVWIAIPFSHAVLLRDIPEYGAGLLVGVLVATFMSDTFAYIGGRLFGQRPLAPRISPNKTIEGLGVGFLGGTLGFWFAGLYMDWLSGTDALLLGACVAAIAPLGDLFESAVKRDLGAKDSGKVFGPHGGVLDRLDAVLFTVVAGYYLSLAIVV